MSDSSSVDVVVSFDTTGSMYPCLTQVRAKVEELVKRLFEEIPDIRMGIIAHGDYCDAGSSYVTKVLPLTDARDKICDFVRTVGATGGGDAPECYEMALYEAKRLAWREMATKAVVMIGDANPHEADYPQNKLKLDWRNELRELQSQNIQVYGVHAMAAWNGYSLAFWKGLAEMTGGVYLTLDQFNEIRDTLLAICYHRSGDIKLLTALREELVSDRKMTRAMAQTFQALTGELPEVTAADAPAAGYGGYSYTPRVRAAKPAMTKVTDAELAAYGDVKLEAIPPGRFQRLEVDKNIDIRGFVVENIGEGSFKKGSGYYQFGKKSVEVQGYKKIVLVDKDSGEMFTGDAARKMLRLPKGRTYNLAPKEVDLDKYWVFVQSTSVNRKLLKGDNFLYEVAEFAEDVGDEEE